MRSAKTIAIFVAHQLLSVCGGSFLAPWIVGVTLDYVPFVEQSSVVRFYHRVLTETPFFPVQIGLGFFMGWKIFRRFRHHAMFWTWMLPLGMLCYAVIAVPTFTPSLTSIMLQSGWGETPLSHYFGLGCQPKYRCFDQILVTMPFYASAAYSAGAFAASRVAITSIRWFAGEGIRRSGAKQIR